MRKTKAPAKRFGSTTEFAERFGFSPAYVLKLIQSGDLKAGVVPRKDSKRQTWRIPVSEFDRFERAINKAS